MTDRPTARWGTPARLNGSDTTLVGRTHESAVLHTWLTAPDGPRLTHVRAERGAGRTEFLRAVSQRLPGTGILTCVPGDTDRPLLLALRVVMALEGDRSPTRRQELAAVDEGDRAAMAALLGAAFTRARPTVVMVDDAQHADEESLALLSGLTGVGAGHEVRVVLSWAGGTGVAGSPHSLTLPPLTPDEVTTLTARRLGARPDTVLARRTTELTRGLPAAIDALLSGWTAHGEIRTADGHAFTPERTPPRALPDENRYLTVLDELGGPARTVATALSILAPLGPAALQLAATWGDLPDTEVHEAVRRLTEAGVVEQIPVTEGDLGQGGGLGSGGGLAFRLPLTAHTLRTRLRPTERARLSAMAVEALWAVQAPQDTQAEQNTQATQPPHATPAPHATQPEQTPQATSSTPTPQLPYLADRIAESAALLDRPRALADLTRAVQETPPGTHTPAVLRWLRAAADLTEDPAARTATLQRYATAAYLACDYLTARTTGGTLLSSPDQTLTPFDLQEIACLTVAVTANERNWTMMSQLAKASWWDVLPVPESARVTGRSLALCYLSRWREASELLTETEKVWAEDPLIRAAPVRFLALAELAQGRPESYHRELALTDAPHLPPGKVYSMVGGMFDDLLTMYDRASAETLLTTARLPVAALPPLSRFLHDHLTGRWDEALESARRLLANDEIQSTPVADCSSLPARTASILLARGHLTAARQLLDHARGPQDGPPQCALAASEAEVLLALVESDAAERALRAALAAAEAHGQLWQTDELWFLLAQLNAPDAVPHLSRVAALTGSSRSRLLHLLATPSPGTLREAVTLARTRALPFETATTLYTAATAGAVPASELHEAYDLFGVTGACLWRFRTRTALRAAGLPVPDRRTATDENNHLLAVLLAEQLTTRQVAHVLGLTENAVTRRVSRLFTHLGMRTRAELVTALLTGAL